MANNVSAGWEDMPLDSRILEALSDLKWTAPTAVQQASIPAALKGRDISIQSRTGSGKTAAFVIPALQRIVAERERGGVRGSSSSSNPVALILVPSVELCQQTLEATQEMAKYVKPRIVVENLTAVGAVTEARIQSAHIVVSTVALLAKHCRSGLLTANTFKNLRYFVIDEADMIVSIAEASLRTVQSVVPSSLQVVMCSATLTEGVASIKGQLLHNPTNIILTSEDVDDAVDTEDSGPLTESRVTLHEVQSKTLQHYYLVATDECHQHTLLYALYRLRLIKGKTLIFVDTDDETYRLQHFLEQLGIATLVYDANLPMNVRLDTLRRFQSGAMSTLVCTDGTLESVEQLQLSLDEEESSHGGAGGSGRGAAGKSMRKRRRGSAGDEAAPSALHRGIDFNKVRNVILFDGVNATSRLALSRYTHRVGRAGRAGTEGVAITFFTVPQARKSIRPLREYCRSRGDALRPFRQMQRAEAAKLQYRVDTVLGNVTRAATRKLRVATVAAELNRSSYLSSHMSQKDTDALRRVVQRSAKKVKVERDLLEVPQYMKLGDVEEVGDYTKRVRADQTRGSKFRKATRAQPVDPLKAVVTKLRGSRNK